MKLIKGDSLEILKRATDNSVDAIVTDPPYGLSFMGKKWDYDVPSTELWKEALRVLKPGGHLLSFAGSRTYHRMAVNIEDAGFEIRDQIMWVYGSGFPKSHNIGKAVDKKLGNEREVTGTKVKKAGDMRSGNFKKGGDYADIELTETKGTSEWEGWGTALKPAHEPIVMARKPFKGTVVDNVLEHGTGGINIDECRVGTEKLPAHSSGKNALMGGLSGSDNQGGAVTPEREGRFPANFIHDGSDDVVGLFPDTGNHARPNSKRGSSNWVGGGRVERAGHSDSGSASRFFYCAKSSKAERNKGLEGFEAKQSNMRVNAPRENEEAKHSNKMQNFHPTVKPIALMRYLVRLVTPKNGTVLDPFMGSGTTGIACKNEGFDFIGIEREQEYIDIAKARIDAVDTSTE